MFRKSFAPWLLSAAALGASSLSLAADLIKVDGSSTVYPITEAMAEEFAKTQGGKVNVTVGVSGTGGGFKKFCRGEIDIADASRPIKTKEREQCRDNEVEYIELPVALDALTVVVNPQNTWVDQLSIEELNKMWAPAAQGTVNNWSQVRAGFPDKPLKLFGPGVDSGTYDYFTEAVNNKAQSSRGDFTASEDDNVLVQGVSTDVNALGYFGLAYYEENASRLKAVPISWKGGAAVSPGVETAKDGSYAPLSRPIFIYVSRKSADKPEVRAFVEFYLNNQNAQSLVKEVGYVPLPAEAYAAALADFRDGKLGTAFTGPAVGVSITDVLGRKKQL